MSELQIIVISYPETVDREIELLIHLFEAGLEHFHLRKPKFSTRRLAEYIEEIPEQYRNRVTIHSHHELASRYNLRGIHFTRAHRKKRLAAWLKVNMNKWTGKKLMISASFHRLKSIYLSKHATRYDYVFLAPVFRSISKRGHEGGFGEEQLRPAIKRTSHKVYALGGVDLSKIDIVHSLGFYGAAILGAVWKSDDPVASYREISERAKALHLEVRNITKQL